VARQAPIASSNPRLAKVSTLRLARPSDRHPVTLRQDDTRIAAAD
jgi:hypothetical protein